MIIRVPCFMNKMNLYVWIPKYRVPNFLKIYEAKVVHLTNFMKSGFYGTAFT